MCRDRSPLSICLKENSNIHERIRGWIWLGISRFHEVVAGIARVADGAGATQAACAEASMADTEAKLPTCRKEFEIQHSLTQWVNPLGIGFRFQTPTRSALVLLGISFNGG